MANTFHGPIDGRYVIPGTHTAAGGTTNFNFGPSQTDSQKCEVVPFTSVPFAPDPDFVDRPGIVAWVRDGCAGAGARAALVGLGGVGKSQLAIRYAHSIRDASPQTFVFWVHASTRARFEEAYRDMADRLQLPGRHDPKANVLRLVSDWLRNESNGQWVMIVDNVDDIETFFPSRKRPRGEADASAETPLATYLPQSRNGAILVTSRSKDAATRLVGGYNKVMEVLAMNESEGLQLLGNKLRDAPAEESAVELLHALDCIPLAITQAAAYINRRARMTVAGYLKEFQSSSKKRESLLNWDSGELRRDTSAFNSVVTTWQMSFEQIRHERRSAAELLSLMSFFNPQGIPESTLRRFSRDAAGAAGAEGKGDEEEADSAFNDDLDMLQAYSLVSLTADNDACEMHALVQFCTQVWLSSFSDAEQWEYRFVALMAQELPPGDFENWAKCQQLFPHVKPLFDRRPAGKETQKAWAQVLTNAARYLWRQGRYGTAQQITEKALAAREDVLGPDNRQTLTSVNNLAAVLQAQGKYEEAEKLNWRALKGSENELGEQHPHTLASVNNLAVLLRVQGKFKEAEKLSWRALEGYKKKLGERHPSTLTSMDNLAAALQTQGKYEEAEMLSRQALEGRKMELGEQHPVTLLGMGNLAMALQMQGRYTEAEKLNRKALEGRKYLLGERHPNTLTSMDNLAGVLQMQGKYEEAETLTRQVLQERKEELGERHPDTLSSIHALAYLLHTLRQYTEAAELYQQAYDGFSQRLGPDHPDTVACRNHFSLLQREVAEARVVEMESSTEDTKPVNDAKIVVKDV